MPNFCRGSSAAELATTLKVVGEVYCPVWGEKRLPTTTNKRRTHPVLQPTSYRQLAKSRWNDAAPASGNLQCDRERTPSGVICATILSPVFNGPAAPSILVSAVTRSRTSRP